MKKTTTTTKVVTTPNGHTYTAHVCDSCGEHLATNRGHSLVACQRHQDWTTVMGYAVLGRDRREAVKAANRIRAGKAVGR